MFPWEEIDDGIQVDESIANWLDFIQCSLLDKIGSPQELVKHPKSIDMWRLGISPAMIALWQRGGRPLRKGPIHSVATHETSLPKADDFQSRCSRIFRCPALSSPVSGCLGMRLVMRPVDGGVPPVLTLDEARYPGG